MTQKLKIQGNVEIADEYKDKIDAIRDNLDNNVEVNDWISEQLLKSVAENKQVEQLVNQAFMQLE